VLAQIAEGVIDGRLVVLPDVAHQAPAEAPEAVARIIRELAQEVGA
jgi:3-oxoadipate enol-lactonase/4-carboxymuconolactone decarboxylase